MEIKAIDSSKIVFLTSVTREVGQLFLPFAIKGLVSRYEFQKSPDQNALLGETYVFQHGHFEGIAINDFSIYTDGFIVSSRSNTDLLDLFIMDLLSWAETELGLRETGIPPREKHYESALIVSTTAKFESTLRFLAKINKSLTKSQESYGLRPFKFEFGAISIAVDTTIYGGRKPTPFTLARRINVPFEADVYHSTAPLKTSDHIQILNDLESSL